MRACEAVCVAGTTSQSRQQLVRGRTHAPVRVGLSCSPLDYQTWRRLRQPRLSGNRSPSQPASSCFSSQKCHFTFPSPRKFKAAHRDNLRILTLCEHRQHFPPSLFIRPPSLGPSSASATRPPRPPSSPLVRPRRAHLFPSLTSSPLLLLPACQDDFKLVASGLT